jgi:hypothetical protein
MERLAMPLVGFIQVDRNLHGDAGLLHQKYLLAFFKVPSFAAS